MVVLLMGVAGAGKTAAGREVARRLGWEFIDGDDLHPRANIEKMAAGTPLDDTDREPWLRRIRRSIERCEKSGSSAVIACSALRRRYRRQLLELTTNTRLVYLQGEPALIASRLRSRHGHFFDPALLASQFETLEEPEDALVISVAADLESVVTAVLRGLALGASASEEEGEH